MTPTGKIILSIVILLVVAGIVVGIVLATKDAHHKQKADDNGFSFPSLEYGMYNAIIGLDKKLSQRDTDSVIRAIKRFFGSGAENIFKNWLQNPGTAFIQQDAISALQNFVSDLQFAAPSESSQIAVLAKGINNNVMWNITCAKTYGQSTVFNFGEDTMTIARNQNNMKDLYKDAQMSGPSDSTKQGYYDEIGKGIVQLFFATADSIGDPSITGRGSHADSLFLITNNNSGTFTPKTVLDKNHGTPPTGFSQVQKLPVGVTVDNLVNSYGYQVRNCYNYKTGKPLTKKSGKPWNFDGVDAWCNVGPPQNKWTCSNGQ